MRRSLTTHSTGARVSSAFIVNLNLSALIARPVNSGVMLPAYCISIVRTISFSYACDYSQTAQ
jgi:hypothetical protein